MFIIDFHCHLSDPKFRNDLDLIIQNSNKLNIKHFILAGTGYKDALRQLEISLKYPDQLSTCFGLHPWLIEKQSELSLEAEYLQIENLFAQSDFIGETGLDYWHSKDIAKRKSQMMFFEKHLDASIKYKKGLILHIVRAHKDALHLLHEKQLSSNLIVHSFSENYEVAKKYLDLGAYLSICNRNQLLEKHEFKKCIAKLPIDRILVESDSPSASKDKSQLNQPASILETIEIIAKLKNIETKDLLEQLYSNFLQIKKSPSYTRA